MNAPGVAKLSSAQPQRSISIPLVDGLGEVGVERLADRTVRITDRAGDLPPYTLEFSGEDWKAIVAAMADDFGRPPPPPPRDGPFTYVLSKGA
jgi:hypothetical protein